MFVYYNKHVIINMYHFGHGEVPWPSGRASDSDAIGRGSILTQVAVLCA